MGVCWVGVSGVGVRGVVCLPCGAPPQRAASGAACASHSRCLPVLCPAAAQMLIYQGLGFKVPQFGHMSLILAPDKSKLSKRHGATSVGEFRE